MIEDFSFAFFVRFVTVTEVEIIPREPFSNVNEAFFRISDGEMEMKSIHSFNCFSINRDIFMGRWKSMPQFHYRETLTCIT